MITPQTQLFREPKIYKCCAFVVVVSAELVKAHSFSQVLVVVVFVADWSGLAWL